MSKFLAEEACLATPEIGADDADLSAQDPRLLERDRTEEPSDRDRPEGLADAVPALPLSYAQERLYFLDRLDPGCVALNVPRTLRLRGALDPDALHRAFNAIAARHETLRTRFRSDDGCPYVVVDDDGTIELPIVEVDGRACDEPEARARAIAVQEARGPFDLAKGPLIRALLIRLGDREHWLVVTIHHIVTDAWSRQLLHRELAAEYEAIVAGRPSPVPDPPIQYADYAAWQRERLSDGSIEGLLGYWKDRLAGMPPVLELPTERPRPARRLFQGAGRNATIPAGTLSRLKDLSRREGVTLYMTLLAAFKAMLARFGAGEDIVVGTVVAGRTQVEVEELLGFFINSLPLRTDLSGGPTFRTLMHRVRETVLGALSHQEMPFELLVKALNPERNPAVAPIFQVVFQLKNVPRSLPQFAGLVVEDVELDISVSQFDLAFDLIEARDGLRCSVVYDPALFEGRTIDRMLAIYARLIDEIVADPSRPIAEMPVQSDDERRQMVVEWNDTAVDIPRESVIHELFQDQARRTPDHPAVIEGDAVRTYAELDQASDRIACRLRACGVGPDVPVGLLAGRSSMAVAAILGILKSGGAYVPLDPAYPARRLAWMLDDCRAPILLARTDLADRIPTGFGGTILWLEEDGPVPAGPAESGARSSAEDLAYVIYTSGSTGEPKGVAVPHRAVTRLVFGNIYVPLDDRQVYLLMAPLSFDASTFELWAPLLHGSTCVVFPEGPLDLAALERTIRRHRVTCLWLTAALFNTVIDQRPSILAGVSHVLTGGEALSVPHVRKAFDLHPGTRFINGYGPTECTTFACTHEIPRELPATARSVPIGRPIGNTKAYVLDSRFEPAPIGVAGELYLGGDGLARGYLYRPEMTTDRFVPSPFDQCPDVRLYRTGDRARWLEDGTLEFLGRLDSQVKLRGFRIEPGEIEASLLRLPGVEAAAVLLRDDGEIGPRLVAYVVPKEGAGPISGPGLREGLRDVLPENLVPSAFVLLDALPMTANGKLDRRALPPPLASAPAPSGGVAPGSRTESRLVAIWRDCLGRESIGVRENFFDLGGHSLLAIRIAARIRAEFGVAIPVRAIFEEPTIAGLARRLEAAEVAEPHRGRDVPGHDDASARCVGPTASSAQERLWFLDRLQPGDPAYNVPLAMRLRGNLDVPRLQRAVDAVVRRHAALRTAFRAADGRLVLDVAEPGTVAVPIAIEELDSVPPEHREAEAARLAQAEVREPFRLASHPLVRLRLFRLDPTEWILVLTLHHTISDEWSLSILVRQMAEFYALGCDPDTIPPDDSATEFAAWERRALLAPEASRGLDYWRAQLQGAPARSGIPGDRPRMPGPFGRAGSVAFELDAGTARALRDLSRIENATPYMTCLAGFALALGQRGHQDDLIIGTPVARRDRPEFQDTVGYLVNTLPLRLKLGGHSSFRALLRAVGSTVLDALLHQEVPFERMVQLAGVPRELGVPPLVQALFTMNREEIPLLTLPGVEASRYRLPLTSAKVDLLMSLTDLGTTIMGRLVYNADLFDVRTAERVCADFAAICRQVAADPDRPAELEVSAGDAPMCVSSVRPEPPETAPSSRTLAAVPDSIEARLAALWGEILWLSRVDPGDNFFDMGGHSLLAVRLFGRIEEEFGYAPPVTTLLTDPTVERFAAVIRRHAPAVPMSLLVELNPAARSEAAPFLCFPGASDEDGILFGAGIFLAALARQVGPVCPFLGVNLGVEPGPGETLSLVLPALADRFIADLRIAYPRGPYRLGGYSLGGLVALEVARRLIGDGESVDLLALFDVYGPHYPRPRSRSERIATHRRNLRGLSAAEQFSYFSVKMKSNLLARFSGLRPKSDKSEILLRSYRSYLNGLGPYPGRITLFRAMEKAPNVRFAHDDPTQGWGRIAEGGVEVVPVPGDHLTMLRPPHIASLAEALRDRLRGTTTGPRG